MSFKFSSPGPNRQPRASDAHPCTAPCARRRTTDHRSFESQTGFTLPLVLHQPMHTVRQQPARLMTSHRQQVCAPLLPRRCTGMRSQDNDRHPTLRPSKPLQYAQSARQLAHRQPPASGAHPCAAPCVRRCRPTTQCDSRTGFNLPSVLHRSMHTVRQQPRAYGTTIGNGCAAPLPPVPAPQPAQLSRKSAAHSGCRLPESAAACI